MTRPGIVTSQSTRSAAANPRVPGAARWFAAFQSEKGSTTVAKRCTSLADFENEYGVDVTYGWGWKAAEAFFYEGGGEMWGIRAVGTTPVKALATLVDRAGSPLTTLVVTALNYGAYANGWKVVVTAGTVSGVKVAIQDSSGVEIESGDNLATPAAIAAYAWQTVTIANSGSATAAPNNLPALNAGVSPNVLATGTDDRGTIVGANYTAALSLFTYDLGAGKVSVPGISGITASGSSTVGKLLKAHALLNRRWAIIDTAQGDSAANARAVVSDVGTDANGKVAGVFWPWVTLPDGTKIPPSPAVAARHARAMLGRGAGTPAAGMEYGAFDYLSGIDTTVAIDETVQAAMTMFGTSYLSVNVIRPRQGRTEIFGWRSASTDLANYAGLNVIDVLNSVQEAAEAVAERFLFRPIDGRGYLTGALGGALIGLCDTLSMAGTLHASVDPVTGRQIDPGYAVDVGPGVNTPTTLAANELRARISVRPSPFAELITIEIVRAGFGAVL